MPPRPCWSSFRRCASTRRRRGPGTTSRPHSRARACRDRCTRGRVGFGYILSLAVSDDGRLVATNDPVDGVQLYEAASMAPVGFQDSTPTSAVAFSPDGSLLAAQGSTNGRRTSGQGSSTCPCGSTTCRAGARRVARPSAAGPRAPTSSTPSGSAGTAHASRPPSTAGTTGRGTGRRPEPRWCGTCADREAPPRRPGARRVERGAEPGRSTAGRPRQPESDPCGFTTVDTGRLARSAPSLRSRCRWCSGPGRKPGRHDTRGRHQRPGPAPRHTGRWSSGPTALRQVGDVGSPRRTTARCFSRPRGRAAVSSGTQRREPSNGGSEGRSRMELSAMTTAPCSPGPDARSRALGRVPEQCHPVPGPRR